MNLIRRLIGLRHSIFFRNVTTLVSGATIAQVVAFLLSPILTRLYDPEAFGIYSLYMSIVNVFAVLFTCRYEMAIMLPREKRNAQLIFSGTIWIILLFVVLSLPVLYFTGTSIATFFERANFVSFVLYISVSAGVMAFSNTFQQLLNRNSMYFSIATSRMIQGLGVAIGSIAFGLLTKTAMGLILGQIVGWGLSCFYLLYRTCRLEAFSLFHSIREISSELKVYKHFPLYSGLGAPIGIVASGIHIMLFMKLFGGDIVGFLGLSYKLIMIPLGIISSSFGQVFYKKIADVSSKYELKKLYSTFSLYLSVVSALMIFVVWVTPESLMSIIFGTKWANLLPYMRIMSFWFGIQFISSALSPIYTRLQRLKVMLLFDIFHVLGAATSILLGYHFFKSPSATLIIFVCFKVAYYFLAIILAHFLIQQHEE